MFATQNSYLFVPSYKSVTFAHAQVLSYNKLLLVILLDQKRYQRPVKDPH